MLYHKIRISPAYENRDRFKRVLKTFQLVISEIIVVSWLIYGNVMYYSKEASGCYDGSPRLRSFMLAVLIIGYLHFLVYLCIIFIVAAVMYVRYRH